MEVLKIIAIIYFIVLFNMFIYAILDDYLIIRKYGKETFHKFSPYDYKTHLLISAVWPVLFVVGIFIVKLDDVPEILSTLNTFSVLK